MSAGRWRGALAAPNACVHGDSCCSAKHAAQRAAAHDKCASLTSDIRAIARSRTCAQSRVRPDLAGLGARHACYTRGRPAATVRP